MASSFRAALTWRGVAGLREALEAARLTDVGVLVREGKGDLRVIETAARELEQGGVNVIVAFAVSVALAAQRSTSQVQIVLSPAAIRSISVSSRALPGPGAASRACNPCFPTSPASASPCSRNFCRQRAGSSPSIAQTMRQARKPFRWRSDASRVLGLDFVARACRSPEEVLARISALASERADAYFFVPKSLVLAHDQLLLDAASALRLPVMSHELDIVSRGALAGYGVNYRELGRQAGDYVVRILMGTPARELPVQSVTKVAFSINLKTANALGLAIPPTLLARADEVIE